MNRNKYLVDTNILIYHTKGFEGGIEFIKKIIKEDSFNISIITKIEFLGWDKHTPDGFEKCKKLLEFAHVYSVDEDIANKVIELKRKNKIKLGDAIIAATALIYNLKLVTRNTNDFNKIHELKLMDPFE